jgi:T-complex protein 1 subunit theta
VDPLVIKASAIRLVTHAVLTVLSVDQIIMSKAAGGPKLPTSKGMSEAMDQDMGDD